MQSDGKVPRWQRVISALFSLAGTLVLADQLLEDKLLSWTQIAIALVALYGVYMFGCIAVRGKLPTSQLQREDATSKNKSTPGDA